ncbi:methyl-accepting chemotaxis protein [Gracilibacillus dipsosauri]|uniref:methyl-accepting chemotaxis protein n=1 Tax=Gracilibacillus dipsosauri TaxID=178340 RepID=UPI0024093253
MGKKGGKSLRFKLVIFTTLLAMITYSTSALFIYFLQGFINEFVEIPESWYVLGILLLGIIWSGILAFAAGGFITRPLVTLKNAATKVAEGDLQHEMDTTDAKDDEIGALTIAFQKMVTQLKSVLTDIDEHATETIDSVQNMKKAASRSKLHSEALEQTISQISSGAEETSEAIQETAQSVDHSTRLASQVDEKAGDSQQKSNAMVQQLQESNQIINGLITGILQIAENQEIALQDVHRLQQKAKEVENVISLVGDISEQTNLLALNASIEASRAGEEGKGFAVVAEEVRKLADQSSQAVQSISDLIKDMQSDVKGVVNAMQKQVEETRNEMTKGEQTTAVIDEMSGSVLNVAESIKEISTLVDDQLKEMESTQAKSQNVAAIAEETSAGSEEMRATIEEQADFAENLESLAINLEKQAQNLKNQIGQFKLS